MFSYTGNICPAMQPPAISCLRHADTLTICLDGFLHNAYDAEDMMLQKPGDGSLIDFQFSLVKQKPVCYNHSRQVF